MTNKNRDPASPQELARKVRRSSIAQLAEAAGLKKEFGDLDELRKAAETLPDVGGQAGRRTSSSTRRASARRASDIEIKSKQKDLYDMLKSPLTSPSPPPRSLGDKRKSSRRGSGVNRRGSATSPSRKGSVGGGERGVSPSRKGSVTAGKVDETSGPAEAEPQSGGGESTMTRIKRLTLGLTVQT